MDKPKTNPVQDEVLHLRRAVEELSILNEIATVINSTLTVHQIVDLIVHKCIKFLKIEQASVLLLEEKETDNSLHTMIRHADHSSPVSPLRLDTQLTGWMLQNRKPLLINDFEKDIRFHKFADSFPVRSLLAVPLVAKSRMIGILAGFNKKEGVFTQDDQRLLSIISTQSAQVIENARLLEKEQALAQMQHEMLLANRIQTRLLPKSNPEIPGYDIAGISIPALVVGGDYYDFIPVDPAHLAVCLGDVSGKGLSAALLMSNLQATVRSQALFNLSPGECLIRSNALLNQCMEAQKFATLFFGVLDSKSHIFRFANAGHNRPVLFKKNGDPLTIEKAGIALNFLAQTVYEEGTIDFGTHDVLLIYSDGISEATNDKEEEYGEERLETWVDENKNKSASDIVQGILETVNAFSGGSPQGDDRTLVVIKRNE